MPLRDHFHSPLDDRSSWEGFHGGWPMEIVRTLVGKLPQHYVAEPRTHHGAFVEVDIGTFERNGGGLAWTNSNGQGAVAVLEKAPPTRDVETDLLDTDEYEVRVYDTRRGRRLVAAIEIVSPANKDRPEHRRAFVTKCAALLQQNVSVSIIDLVTTRGTNLFADLIELIGQPKSSPGCESPLYAVACRLAPAGERWRFQTWEQPLVLGKPLPTLPLWLAEDLAIFVDLEESYEETCRVLRLV